MASELRRIAEAVGDHELELEGAGWTVVDLLELGDVAGADIQIAAASRLAAALHRPLYEWWTALFRCARAQLDGRFDEAERLADETLAIGRRGHAENAVHVYAQAMFNIRREQGRLGEVRGRRGAASSRMYPAVPAWRCSLALLHLELGREDAARAEFEALADAGLRHAAARRELADRDHAAGRGLRPRRRRGAAPRSCTRRWRPTRGATSSWAGRRRATARPRARSGCSPRCRGEWARAERHFADALAMHAAMGARPVRGAHAARLGGDGAGARARRRRRRSGSAAARAIADELGMRRRVAGARLRATAGRLAQR